jgi:hypothetical protein
MLTVTIFHQRAVQSAVRNASTLIILYFFGTIADEFAACVETAVPWLTRQGNTTASYNRRPGTSYDPDRIDPTVQQRYCRTRPLAQPIAGWPTTADGGWHWLTAVRGRSAAPAPRLREGEIRRLRHQRPPNRPSATWLGQTRFLGSIEGPSLPLGCRFRGVVEGFKHGSYVR